ncbi:MAG: phosphotransferase family protein [Thermoleophilia bacterium]|nr:phosphotransferase family protein [Thermoleophilia bacterium]
MSLTADPLLDAATVERFLDARGLGAGPVAVRRIGEGHSNVTFLVERGGTRVVLRRPPLPPLPPSAHDVLREARVQAALGAAGVPVPRILAVCADASLLGVPFYVSEYVDGAVVTAALPRDLDAPRQRRALGEALVGALVAIHEVDWLAAGLDGFGNPEGYLERQVRRFSALWELNATRELPQVLELAAWLRRNLPEPGPATVVHGDYRLGNVLVARAAPARVLAVLDWELSTIGDPLADVGYLLATYSDAASRGTPLELSPVTRGDGFPSRSELAELYERRTGRTVTRLPWYEALALWKAAVFCEGIYGRHLRGEADGPFQRSLADGVPRLLAAAAEAASGHG